MFRKCKCDCDMKLFIQNMKHCNDMAELASKFDRLYRKFSWFAYTLTGDKKHIDEYEFNRKSGVL